MFLREYIFLASTLPHKIFSHFLVVSEFLEKNPCLPVWKLDENGIYLKYFGNLKLEAFERAIKYRLF